MNENSDINAGWHFLSGPDLVYFRLICRKNCYVYAINNIHHLDFMMFV